MSPNDLKTPIDFNETMEMVMKNPAMVGRGILFLFVCSLIFMTFFASIALYFFSMTEQEFLDNAIETQAQVTNVKQERFFESHSTSGSSSSDGYNVKYVSIITLNFIDQNGQPFTTKTKDGEMSLLEAGDTVKILYDPENNEKVILSRNKNNVSVMRTISYIMGAACFLLFFVAFIFTLFEKHQRVSKKSI